jgi:hypothetical protein
MTVDLRGQRVDLGELGNDGVRLGRGQVTHTITVRKLALTQQH